MTTSIDLLYAGPISFSDYRDLQTLLDIGKAPLGWLGEFTPHFLLPMTDFSGLPAGVSMYSHQLTDDAVSEALKQTRFLLKLDSNAAFLAAPEMKQILNGYPAVSIIEISFYKTFEDFIRAILPIPTQSLVTQSSDSLLELLHTAFMKNDYKKVEELILAHPTLPGAGTVLNRLNLMALNKEEGAS